ncbi:MAG: hypothetical protein WDM87_15835 [Terracidiphilus sp.]
MKHTLKRALAMSLTLPVLSLSAFAQASSPAQVSSDFTTAELNVTPSPASSSELSLPAGTSVVDFDIWPTGADAGHPDQGQSRQPCSQLARGRLKRPPLLDLPATFTAASITVHPLGQRFFVEGKTGQQSQILAVDNSNGTWTQQTSIRPPLTCVVFSSRRAPLKPAMTTQRTKPSKATGYLRRTPA